MTILIPMVHACGPFFPNRYLDASESRLLDTPEAIFAYEVDRIAPRVNVDERAGTYVVRAAKDVDLKTAYELGREAAARTERQEGRADSERRVARDEAVKWFGLTRALAAQGAPDPDNLSRESIGWEAYAEFHTDNFVPAIRLYLRHHQLGDSSAVNSLRFVMRRLFRNETWRKNGVAEKLANDADARRVWTAWLLAQGDQGFGWGDTEYLQRLATAAQTWAELLCSSGVKDVPDADRFAWVAYEGGLFALAEEWAKLAPKDSGAAEWIRGKLALRKGDLTQGGVHLLNASASPELEKQRTTILGELGRVRLAQDRPVEAMAVWLDGGHWEDAAYLAERVLTLDETCAFLDRTSGAEMWAYVNATGGEKPWLPANPNVALAHLTARRLMRANRPDDARKYFPADLQMMAGAYVGDVRLGFDLTQPDDVRAAAFWRAAQTVHAHGLELLGTELEPDWAIWGGNYDTGSAAKARQEPDGMLQGAFAVTGEELSRLGEHVVPEQRFHYRYRAAQLAWWAVTLMPNDSEETAAVLAKAGRWMRYQDPKTAKEFYQALVIRCGRTELGKKAAERRWFPD
ncbi:MAG: hypothetical protein QM760_02180 [Nibricoccus sp.]